MESLVINAEHTSCFALVPSSGLEGEADRLPFGLGRGAARDLFQREARHESVTPASRGGYLHEAYPLGALLMHDVAHLLERSGVDAVLLHLEVQGLEIGSKHSCSLAFVAFGGL